MSSRRDFLRSVVTDSMLPTVRQLLQDVVMEVINERQIPTRTDYKELRDVVNGMRGQTSSAKSTTRALEKRVVALEAEIAELKQALAAR